jgi:hypothetical protein
LLGNLLGLQAFGIDRDGHIGNEHLELRLKEGIAICPSGKLALISTESNKAYFDERDCRVCPLKAL